MFRYPYLFKTEKLEGLEEGSKRRPCVVVVRYGPLKQVSGHYVVDVAAITHSPQGGSAVELPHRVKQRMQLDDDASWVVTSEMNRFIWPGPDFGPAFWGRGNIPTKWHWGVMPQDVFKRVQQEILVAKLDLDNVVTRPNM